MSWINPMKSNINELNSMVGVCGKRIEDTNDYIYATEARIDTKIKSLENQMDFLYKQELDAIESAINQNRTIDMLRTTMEHRFETLLGFIVLGWVITVVGFVVMLIVR